MIEAVPLQYEVEKGSSTAISERPRVAVPNIEHNLYICYSTVDGASTLVSLHIYGTTARQKKKGKGGERKEKETRKGKSEMAIEEKGQWRGDSQCANDSQ